MFAACPCAQHWSRQAVYLPALSPRSENTLSKTETKLDTYMYFIGFIKEMCTQCCRAEEEVLVGDQPATADSRSFFFHLACFHFFVKLKTIIYPSSPWSNVSSSMTYPDAMINFNSMSFHYIAHHFIKMFHCYFYLFFLL